MQDQLTQKAKDLGITVLQGPQYAIQSGNFDRFAQDTGAKIIVGTDGARSQVRHAMGAELTNEFTVSYLLELKYKTRQINPRKLIDSSFQYTKDRGFDFETIGRQREPGQPITVSLHKFINQEIYLSLRKIEDDKGKGSPENPWDMRELKALQGKDPNIQFIHQYFTRYFADHGFEEGDYFKEKIIAFPLKIYRSSSVAQRHGQSIVLLAGDSSSGMVLERGVNKGFIEAALCAQSISTFFKNGAVENISPGGPLPLEFQDYQQKTRALFFKESRFARMKFSVLTAGEAFLTTIVKFIQSIISCHQSLLTLIPCHRA